jgi:hypothetical protein
VEEAQPDPIPGLEFEVPVTTIVLQLVVVLRLLEPLPHLADELITLHELLVNGRQVGLARCVGTQGWWFSAIDNLEWS